MERLVKEFDLVILGRQQPILIVATTKFEAEQIARLWMKEQGINPVWRIEKPETQHYKHMASRILLYEREINKLSLPDNRIKGESK